MSWCEECTKYWPADQLDENGACPTCGTVVGDPPTVPWHFKLLVVAAAVYIAWRIVQGIGWLVARL